MEQYTKSDKVEYFIDTSGKSLETFEQFLKKKRKKNGDKLIDSTIERYVYFVKRFEKIFINAQLTTTQLDKLITDIGGSVIYSVVHAWLQFCGFDKRKDRRFYATLSNMVRSASAQSSQRFLQSKVQSVQEMRALIEREENLLYQQIYLFSYDTACRRIEVFKLRWKHIQFIGERTAELANIYAIVTINGKGQKQRTVYLHKNTARLLNNRKVQTNAKDNDLVFRLPMEIDSRKFYKHPEHAYYKHLVRHAENVLGKSVHPHCFRHTRLTHMADSVDTPDPFGIMMYAGHADISTSMIYIELSPTRAKKAFITSSRPLFE